MQTTKWLATLVGVGGTFLPLKLIRSHAVCLRYNSKTFIIVSFYTKKEGMPMFVIAFLVINKIFLSLSQSLGFSAS